MLNPFETTTWKRSHENLCWQPECAEVETQSPHSISALSAPVDLEAWNRNWVLYGSFMGLLDPRIFLTWNHTSSETMRTHQPLEITPFTPPLPLFDSTSKPQTGAGWRCQVCHPKQQSWVCVDSNSWTGSILCQSFGTKKQEMGATSVSFSNEISPSQV